VPEPKGAFYLFPDFESRRERLAERGVQTSFDMCEQLLEETGVAILPGSAFGRPPEELTARLAYVDFDGARALATVERMSPDERMDSEILRRIAPSVVEAIDRLAEWCSS
jgi:aspartate aminotransferase